MSYITFPGSLVDYYSGSVLVEEISSTAATDGTVSGKFVKIIQFWKIYVKSILILFLFLAEGMPFIIEVFNSNNAMTSAAGFSLIYTQIPCMGNRQ